MTQRRTAAHDIAPDDGPADTAPETETRPNSGGDAAQAPDAPDAGTSAPDADNPVPDAAAQATATSASEETAADASEQEAASASAPEGAAPEQRAEDSLPEQSDPITDPAKVIRMGHVSNKLLEELKGVELDPAGRKRLAKVHLETVAGLRESISAELQAELDALTPALSSRSTPSQSELLVAQASLVGWLDGLAMSSPHVFVPRQAVAIDQSGAGIIIGGPPGARGHAPQEESPAGPGEAAEGHPQGNYL